MKTAKKKPLIIDYKHVANEDNELKLHKVYDLIFFDIEKELLNNSSLKINENEKQNTTT